MRLIDADKTCKELIDTIDWLRKENYETYSAVGDDIVFVLDKQATSYDVDEVVEKLEELHEKFCNSVTCGGKSIKSMCKDCEEYIMFKKNIEIVKAGGIE